jgi:Domain of unknown function (DUF6434)
VAEPLTMRTVLPPRQASSQQIRAFLVAHIGASFFFDIHMRNFLKSDAPKTLGEVIDHWHASRDTAKPQTLPQLELVRFTKAWHLAHPGCTAVQCRAAWHSYKSLPVDQRPEL